MVLAAMANPPEHDFAPSWLKIPSDQQKRGQKLGAPSSPLTTTSSDQWSGNSKSNHQDDAAHNKSRHRHFSSSDSPASSSSSSSHQSGGSGNGGYGGRSSSVTSSGGAPQGSYGYRGRETDRRNYPRPGSGSRHHSVDDLNGFPDYGGGGWNLSQYDGGNYSNYPRRGGSSTGPRDGYGGNSRYGDVFHPSGGSGGRGSYYGNGSRGGSAGRQRYNSGSRAGFNDRENHPDVGESSEILGKKKDRTERDSKNSALSSNDFPSLVGDNSKTSAKDRVTRSSTPGGVWDKPPGAAKVQISGRKVQLIKKSIHNDLPPRDPSTSSSKSSSKSTSSGAINPEGSKASSGGHIGSGTRVNRPVSSSSTAPPNSSSSSNGSYKSSPASAQKPSAPVKVHPDSSGSSSTHMSSKPPNNDSSNLSHSPKSSHNIPPKSSSDIPAPKLYHQHHPTAHQTKSYEKKAIDIVGPGNKPATSSKTDLSSPPKASTVVMAKNEINTPHEGAFTSTQKDASSKAGPVRQTQAYVDAKSSFRREPAVRPETVIVPTQQKAGASKVSGTESPTKPVLVQTAKVSSKVSPTKPVLVQTAKVSSKVSPTKPVLVQTAKVSGKVSPTKPVLVQTAKVSGKESPTKPVLVQTPTTAVKPTIKLTSVKSTNGKPVLKESPIRPAPIQIKSTTSTKFSGKESPVRSFPSRTTTNQKQNNRSVRPGPVQIKSNRLVGKETPPVRSAPVNTMLHKSTAAKDNSSDADTRSTRPVLAPFFGNKEKQSSPVTVNPFLAKEPSTIPTSTPPVDIHNARLSHNKNVNNSDGNRDVHTHLQNGGDNWPVNGPLRIEDAGKMNGPSLNETESTDHITTNGLDNNLHSGMDNLQLSSSLEAEKRLLQEMGWHEHSDNEEGYAPITEDEMKEFQRRSQQLKTQRNGFTRNVPAAFLSSSLPNTPMTSIDLDDALSSCSSDSSDDDL